jgi:hypothetical protein
MTARQKREKRLYRQRMLRLYRDLKATRRLVASLDVDDQEGKARLTSLANRCLHYGAGKPVTRLNVHEKSFRTLGADILKMLIESDGGTIRPISLAEAAELFSDLRGEYHGVTDEMERRLASSGRGRPRCPSCRGEMFPVDDHGRYSCSCSLDQVTDLADDDW